MVPRRGPLTSSQARTSRQATAPGGGARNLAPRNDVGRKNDAHRGFCGGACSGSWVHDWLAGPAFALDKVTFATNWVADPEASGFYQALVERNLPEARPRRHHQPGGPTSNGGMLLIAGKIDFYMGGDMIGDLRGCRTIFRPSRSRPRSRRTRRSSCRRPGVGLDKWQDLPKAPAFVSSGAVNTFWAWMRLAYGFKDENIKPYNLNSAPFIVDHEFHSAGLSDLGAVRGREEGTFQAQRVPPLRLSLHDLFDRDSHAPRSRRGRS